MYTQLRLCSVVVRGVGCCATIAPALLAAQQPVMIPLKPANGTVRDSLVGSSVRELRDGRVIVATQRGLYVVDFEKGTGEPIVGPESGILIRLGGDTTLIEASNTGWIFLDGKRLLGMLPLTNAVVAAVPMTYTSGADSRGIVLSVTGGQPASDSATVARIERATGRQAIVTRVWQGPCACGGRPAPIFVVNEMPVLAFDGWIAVVRAHPYRVDWQTPAGQWVLGAPLPVPQIKMDEREQAAYWAHWGAKPNASTHIDWPEWVEPFTYPQPMATPDGKVLVSRWPTADAPGVRYDLINRRGEREGQILLAGAHDRIVGFGANSVYVLTTSIGDGPIRGPASQTLERHPWQ